MRRTVLGIDVAMTAWAAIGSATIEFDDHTLAFTKVVPGAIAWPDAPLTPASLAAAIDRFARKHDIRVIAIDGPQGWRHPDTPLGAPGVGRRCEYACRTQGKTGVYPRTYPGTQRAWIDFSVHVFDELLARPGVELADAKDWQLKGAYGVLECFPTSAWRSSGLTPLPAKSKRPAFPPYISALQAAYALPAFTTKSHDDLQAVMAAVAAAAAGRGPARAIPEGDPSSMNTRMAIAHRVEGLIWNVAPLEGKGARKLSAPVIVPPEPVPEVTTNASVYVTQRVLDQVAASGDSHMQISCSLTLGGTRRHRVRVTIQTEDEEFKLLAGDTHTIWRTHQDPDTIDAFDRLFSQLADQSGTLWHVVLEVAGVRLSDGHARRRVQNDTPKHAPNPEPAPNNTSGFQPSEANAADLDAASRLLNDALARPNELSIAVPVAMALQSSNASFYCGSRAFDATHFSRIDGMLTALRPQLDAFRSRRLTDLQPADRTSIVQLFTSLACIVGANGAAIVLHLWSPEFFPAWNSTAPESHASDAARAAAEYWSFVESRSLVS